MTILEPHRQAPRVSVVIPAYNAEAFLGETLDAVLKSSLEDIEIIVIDDGSKDGTAFVAAARGPRVRVLSQQNAGMSASRNRGVLESRGEFIAFLDSDDIWHPDKLRLQVQALDMHPECGFCFTEFQGWPGGSDHGFSAQPRTGRIDASMHGWLYHKMVLTNWALPSSVLLRRTVWNALGPFLCVDQQTDDWEYFIRASRKTQFIKLAEPLVLYRQSPLSLSRKLPLANTTELMRESQIARYGLRSPDGTEVDSAELECRRHKGWIDFAVTHLAQGRLSTGWQAAMKELRRGYRRRHTLKCVSKALIRRVVRRQYAP